MSRKDNFRVIYDKIHNIQVNRDGLLYEERPICLTILDLCDSIQIKAKDITEFLFNYTINIDLRAFEAMRIEQSLDINFSEFKTNLIEMLQQTNRKEMYLKCDCDTSKCKLIFYGKSKIKSIIYLIIDLQITNQKEIFDEMYANIQELQENAKDLQFKLQASNRIVQNKDKQIENLTKNHQQLIKQFLEQLKSLDLNFNQQLNNYTTKLLNKLLILSKRLLKLVQDVNFIKTDLNFRTNSNRCLLTNFEHLKLETIESTNLIRNLQTDKANLENLLYKNEGLINELKLTVQEKEEILNSLHKEIDVLQTDLQQATIIIAQKTAANDELGRDLVQANQMIVNFNNRYDLKLKELDEVQQNMSTKDKIITEQNHRFRDLHHSFEEYKLQFNLDNENRIRNELFLATKKIQELEKSNGETMKLNELLTRKLSSGNFINLRGNVN